ncbi:MAG: hypothetical protein QOG11_799, partial [Solirubrobacteraceae bacterium]|nr:hypothetical protein [Solirubrobacteraceae bacterium]
MRTRFRSSALCVAVLAGGLLTGCAAERPEDPVVLTGAATPRLVGANPGEVVAFRWLSNAWAQVPVQVDERAQIDLGKVYNQPAKGLTSLTYTDPGTFAGPDPDPKVDADDELAFMGFDGGAQAPAGAAPPGVVAGSGEEVRIDDSLGNPLPAFIYLFRQTGGLDPGAGRSYVSYTFGLKSGAYKTTYKLAAGPNPEDSTITTAAYTRHFSDRWIDDGLQLRTTNSSGVDILDRHKALFFPGVCGRSEDTFSAAEGAFIVNKSGPVRALRAYVGANSGPYTERLHVFYQRREDITTSLRVHSIPGVMDFFDYSPAASGMTYRNNLNANGVKVDGVPDAPGLGALTWESVDGDQGGLAQVHETATTIPSFASTSYYLDQKA